MLVDGVRDELLRRRPGSLAGADRRRRADRGRARTAERALRLRRDRRRRADHHAARRAAVRDAPLEGGSRDARRAGGQHRAARSAAGVERSAATTTRTMASPAPRRPTARRCRTTTPSCSTVGRRSAGAATAARDLLGTFRYVDTDRGSPGPYGSNPAGNFSGVDRISRSVTRAAVGGGAAGCSRSARPASRVRQRVEADVADFDLEYQLRLRLVEVETDARARASADRRGARRRSVGERRRRVAQRERARSTFITGRRPTRCRSSGR